MGADRNQWQFPKNVAGNLIGWRDDGKGLENKSPDHLREGISARDFVNVTGDGSTDDSVALQAAINFCGTLAANIGRRVRFSMPDTYFVSPQTYYATADWRSCLVVPDNVMITGPGRIVYNVAFASKSVVLLCRGDNITVDGLDFENVATSPFAVEVGAGDVYDDDIEDAREYVNLEVRNCRFTHCWLGASVQMAETSGKTTTWNGVDFVNCIATTKPAATSGGNFNVRSEPPLRIKNAAMVNCRASDGKTASSFNAVGIDGIQIIGCRSQRNLYAACEIENGCRGVVVIGLTGFDDAQCLWIDDSNQGTVCGVNFETETETLVTPLLGTFHLNRAAIHITRQGYPSDTGHTTGDLIIQNVVGKNGRILIEPFSGAPAGAFSRVMIDGFILTADGVTRSSGNRGVTVSTGVPDLTLRNGRIVGFPDISISLVTDTGTITHISNVETKKIGSESSTGIATSGAGRIVCSDFNPHSVSYAHTGGSEFSQYKINSVPQPNRQFFAQVTIADDAATSIDLPVGDNAGNFFIERSGSASAWGRARVVWSGSFASAASGGTSGSAFAVNATQGTLTGTTGSDGFLTIRANTDSKLYIENRLGASAEFFVIWEA